jgi:hypothetical protein
MVLTMRYTGSRIGDTAMLAKDRISRDGRALAYLSAHREDRQASVPADSG